MSKSSRMLKATELPDLQTAQAQAATMPHDYLLWRTWMRDKFSYALVVRMAVHMGCKIPGRTFYNLMWEAGLKLVQRRRAA